MKCVKVLKRFIQNHPPNVVLDMLTNRKIKRNIKMIENNEHRFNWLKENLEDDYSKKVLSKVLQYRKTGDYSFLNDIAETFYNQYFDKILTFSENETFIDCGGFLGETTQQFILRNPNYKHVFLYEPICENFDFCKKSLSSSDLKITLRNNCVGNENKTVYMMKDSCSSHINTKGKTPARVVKLDDDLQMEHPTFVKMDVEGFELEALKGMSRIMKEDKPKLAICVYHKPMDILEIPEFIKLINPAYKLSLRQYIHSLECENELVLYAY